MTHTDFSSPADKCSIRKLAHAPLLALAFAHLLPLQAAEAPVGATTPKRPNILFIMTDDQGAWSLGSSGNPQAHTPNLDRLANEGARMENAFAVAAVSSPARAGVLTGRYASEMGIFTYLPKHTHGLPEGVATWPELLRKAGYRTALVGKWHLGDAGPEDLPTAKGYEFFSGWPVGGNWSRDPVIQVEGKPVDFKGQYTSDALTDLAIGYIERFKDQPFAISLHFWAPHANQGVPPGFTLPYDDRTWLPLPEQDLSQWQNKDLTLPEPDFPKLDKARTLRMLREYHASVQGVDRNVGRILDKLKELGLDDNTIVVFTADQGFMVGQHGLWHKGNAWWLTTDGKDPAGLYGDLMEDRPMVVRDNLYDNVLRVPALVRWPAGIKAGGHPQETFTHLDWFPTLMAMTHVEIPQGTVLRGQNFLPALQGDGDGIEPGVMAQHQKLRAWRTPQYKLVRDFSRLNRDEFYDLQKDPKEQANLANSQDPAVREHLRQTDAALRAHMKEINDPLYPYAEAWPIK